MSWTERPPRIIVVSAPSRCCRWTRRSSMFVILSCWNFRILLWDERNDSRRESMLLNHMWLLARSLVVCFETFWSLRLAVVSCQGWPSKNNDFSSAAAYLVKVSNRSVSVATWEHMRRWYSRTPSSLKKCRTRNTKRSLKDVKSDIKPFNFCTVSLKSRKSSSMRSMLVANTVPTSDAA